LKSCWESWWRLLRYTVTLTFASELAGTIVLFAAFGKYDLPFGERLWFSVFHSVSAFCNAGLDVFGLVGKERGWAGSLQPFAHDLSVVLTIAALLMLGGLGFPVVVEISDRIRGNGPDGQFTPAPFSSPIWSCGSAERS